MMSDNQTQKAGNNSRQIQAQSIIINNGIEEKRAREIFHEMFDIARKDLTQEANEIAQNRVERFERDLMPKIEKVEGAINSFGDPAFQFALVNAHKAAAASNREADLELLSELLLHRIKRKDNKNSCAGIGKAIEIVDDISDEDFKEKVTQYSVYARVQPEHKVRIVNAWKSRGMITAMTGDGVNDAPSIKSADIGVGMGITGTDVTKNVADMVLADDNFATIVSAVEEGRRIYDNIRKSIQFLLSSNLSEVMAIFTANLLGFTILKPVHLLWINLVTDCFPALALSMEKGEKDLMKRPPRKSSDGIFAGGVGFDVVYQGLFVTLLTLAAYFIGHFMEAGRWELTESADGMTMAFLTMSMCEIFHSFNMRSQHGSTVSMLLHGSFNKYIFGSTVLSLITTALVIEVPFLADAFDFTTIDAREFFTALGLAFLIIPLVEIVKAIERAVIKNKAKKQTVK